MPSSELDQPTLSIGRMNEIRTALPKAAFRPDPSKLIWMFLHLAIILAAYALIGRLGWSCWLLVAGAVAGHSLACIAFYVHDLSHGSVVRGVLGDGCEWLFLGLLLIAPTFWRRVHNQTHHATYNTPADPDRPYFIDELNGSTQWYVRLFYPNAEALPWNPLVLVHFIPYIVRNTVAALLPGRLKPAVVPALGRYKRGEAWNVAFELLFIVVLQFGLFWIADAKSGLFLVVFAGINVTASAVTMSYIFTNHFLNPVEHEPDPIRGSTSVIVPAWVDRIHVNFSYHSEHHLFPGMNSDYYPALSRILAEKFPQTYCRVPMVEAWRRLWRNRAFVERPAGRVA